MRILLSAYNPDVRRFFDRLLPHLPWPAEIVSSRSHRRIDWIPLHRWPWRSMLQAARMHLARRIAQQRWRGLIVLRQLHFMALFLRVARTFLAAHRTFRCGNFGALVVWNGLRHPDNALVLAARFRGMPVLHFEFGALPNTLAIDGRGVNFTGSIPRDATFYRTLPAIDFEVEKPPVRPALAPRRASAEPLPDQFLFAPFQVEADTQVVLFSPWINTMRRFYGVLARLQRRLRATGSPLRIVLKEHPSCPVDFADLHARAPGDGLLFANDMPTAELVAKASAVVTLNSSVGIEALQLNKPVILLGQAFYAINGLVQRVGSEDELFEAVRTPCPPDAALRAQFLGWLRERYYARRFVTPPPVVDRLRTQGGEDWDAIVDRMRRVLESVTP